jgi:Na+-transporting NADH:ubiquinone oxidoreductase subunit NqrC
VPRIWKVGMVILVACLLASIVIATIQLTTTPTEIMGDGYRGLPAERR